MTNVVMTGSFDGVHEGHLHIMQLAKQLENFSMSVLLQTPQSRRTKAARQNTARK
jgi:cytidyltransferase-like protein